MHQLCSEKYIFPHGMQWGAEPPTPQKVTYQVLKFFNHPPPPSPQTFYYPLQLDRATSAFFTHDYFQQAHVNISEAVITD